MRQRPSGRATNASDGTAAVYPRTPPRGRIDGDGTTSEPAAGGRNPAGPGAQGDGVATKGGGPEWAAAPALPATPAIPFRPAPVVLSPCRQVKSTRPRLL